MKSLNIDIIFPWEIGLLFVIFGCLSIFLGMCQSKKSKDDMDNVPFTKATTKIFFGSVFCLFGFIQMLSLLK